VLFDVFQGGPIPEGKKSLAFSLEFRAPDRTLTDDEAEQAVQSIVHRLAREFGAELRAG
jgi:phenylalanyl-tRNA synthetase beta chain